MVRFLWEIFYGTRFLDSCNETIRTVHFTETICFEVMYDRLLVNPSIELKPNLEYQQWLISQKILTEVHFGCEFPLGKVKALGKCFDETGLSRTQPDGSVSVSRCRRFGVWLLCELGVRKVSIGIHGHGDQRVDTSHEWHSQRFTSRTHRLFLESLSWFEMFQSIACWT